MKLTLLHGYPDYIGKRWAFCGNGVGPTSYVQKTSAGGGDPVVPVRFQNYIDIIFPAMSVSGTYIVYPYPVNSAIGPRLSWALKWVTISTGAEVAASTDLSAEKVQLGGFGGDY
jgi:hypothetical protein